MRTQQIKAYKLDISQTNMDGSFQCPCCRTKISPDDQSDTEYIIDHSTMRNNELDEVVIHCKMCLSFVHLGGFLEISKQSHVAPVYFNHV